MYDTMSTRAGNAKDDADMMIGKSYVKGTLADAFAL